MCLFVAVFDSGFHEGAPETTDFKGPAKIYSESESERANITIGPRITENFPHILCGGGEDISSMCDMLRSPRTQCNAPKNAITPWKMGRWTISILLEGKKRHDKDFYLQIHHLDFAILLLCVSHSFFFCSLLFLVLFYSPAKTIHRITQKIHVNTIYVCICCWKRFNLKA